TYNPARPPVTVPAIRGLDPTDAENLLASVGLKMTSMGNKFDESRALGTISRQEPEGQTSVAAGSTVKVWVNFRQGRVKIPDTTGQMEQSATKLLEGDPFFLIVKRIEESNSTVGKGQVIRTDPAVDMEVQSGSAITLVVSSGPVPIDMPNVKGFSEADAKKALDAVALKYTIEYVDLAAGNGNIGKVIAQDTAAGTKVDPTKSVVLTVGRFVDPGTTVPPPSG
ncbi:MAG: PASTA domain-containing protein, partial [Actinomycetota bacterium]